jgi:hypothetical protein
MDFHAFDHNFCESKIYSDGSNPEFFNAGSSLFITFIGFNGLRRVNQPLYAAFVINGLTSCGYHLLNTIGWGLLDRMSMILIAWTCSNLMDIPNVLRHAGVPSCLRKISTLLVLFYFTVLLTAAGLHWETVFNLLFGVFLTSLAGYVYYVGRHSVVPTAILTLAQRGLKYLVLSGLFWVVTENLCGLPYVKYLFGHVWWHIFVSYGGYLISLTPLYLQNRRLTLRYDVFGLPYLMPSPPIYRGMV